MTPFLAIGVLLAIVASSRADDLQDLSRDFWVWRAANQPVSSDDIPRIERPVDWTPDGTTGAVARRRKEIGGFEERLSRLDPSGMPVSWEVDRRLLRSAFARVRWELDIERGWQRNPMFYVDQTVGAIYDRFLQPPPFSKARSGEILRRLASVPVTIDSAKGNLVPAEAPFARLAAVSLDKIRERLSAALRAVKPLLAASDAARIDAAAERAIASLENYREWLINRAPTLRAQSAVGREGYLFFLKNVALLPYTPEELLAMGRQEWARSVARETIESAKNAGVPELPLPPDQAAQIARNSREDEAVRRFLGDKNLLTVPRSLRRYRNAPIPPYIAALEDFGEGDDLTSPSRLSEDATRYIPAPSASLSYFLSSTAKDPRPSLVHEGVPGHFFQLAVSWSHEDAVRRGYYDSSANEGIAFYAEEMMLDAGFFDDSPRTREIVASWMRLRALRVEADVQLALGNFSIDQAADYLARTVPMDPATARGEAEFFASTPGQAIAYQIGKLQILRFLADARRVQGEKFSLRAFHNSLWKNGNVPIALQRFEYLGLRDDLVILDRR